MAEVKELLKYGQTDLSSYAGEDAVISAEELKKHLEATIPERKYYPTGFPTLDSMIRGLRETEWVLVSGPSKHGKTCFITSLLCNLSSQGIPTLMFSLDMPEEDLIERIYALPVPPIFYTPKTIPKRALPWIDERIREGMAKYGVKFVFVDNIMKVFDQTILKSLPGGSPRTQADEMGLFAEEVKDMVRKYKIGLITTHHIVKMTEDMRKRELDAKDIRGSALLAAECDATWMVWRDQAQDKKTRQWSYTRRTILKLAEMRRAGAYMGEKIILNWDNEILSESVSENLEALIGDEINMKFI